MNVHMADPHPVQKLLLTPVEAADALRVSRSTVYVLLAANRLESIRIGRNRRIPADALDDFVAGLRASAE